MVLECLHTEGEPQMDSAARSNRQFPSYTLAQLEATVAAGQGTPVMVQEIADRKAGKSVTLVTPQIQARVGRM